MQHPVSLEGDSSEYGILYDAAQRIKGVPGFTIEIGLRRGGGTEVIVQAFLDNQDRRIHVAIDPYGDLPLPVDKWGGPTPLDYSNAMKAQSLPRIFQWCADRGVEFLFFNMEDIEFFKRFSDGVPVYSAEKTLRNEYALVFFDGPHAVDAIRKEVEFFIERSPLGAIWVFDDIRLYDHRQIDQWLAARGFESVKRGTFKQSYRKMRETASAR